MSAETIERGYVYRFFDVDGGLLYVGITRDMSQRFAAHRREARWWFDVATVTVEVTAGMVEAEYAEAVAILSERPAHNRSRPSVERARSRVESDGVDVRRLVAAVEELRTERDALYVRAVVAEATAAQMGNVAATYRDRAVTAVANMRHAEECAALESARLAREAAESRLQERLDALPVFVSGWGDDL